MLGTKTTSSRSATMAGRASRPTDVAMAANSVLSSSLVPMPCLKISAEVRSRSLGICFRIFARSASVTSALKRFRRFLRMYFTRASTFCSSPATPAMAAAGAIEGVAGDEQKVLALVKYIRKNLRNLFSAEVTEAERAKILKQMPKDRERTSAEIFKQGIGTSDELNTLFAAMATSVGLEARPAMVADREDVVFVPNMTDRYFLRSIDMAVNIGEKWKLYDVSAHLLPANMLSWREEGMKALLSDPKKPLFVESPLSPPEASAGIRSAKLMLLEDGSIEGD